MAGRVQGLGTGGRGWQGRVRSGVRSQGSDFVHRAHFFRKLPQSALHQRLASRLSEFVQRAHIQAGGVRICMNEFLRSGGEDFRVPRTRYGGCYRFWRAGLAIWQTAPGDWRAGLALARWVHVPWSPSFERLSRGAIQLLPQLSCFGQADYSMMGAVRPAFCLPA
jgi:hypothetical protein